MGNHKGGYLSTVHGSVSSGYTAPKPPPQHQTPSTYPGTGYSAGGPPAPHIPPRPPQTPSLAGAYDLFGSGDYRAALSTSDRSAALPPLPQPSPYSRIWREGSPHRSSTSSGSYGRSSPSNSPSSTALAPYRGSTYSQGPRGRPSWASGSNNPVIPRQPIGYTPITQQYQPNQPQPSYAGGSKQSYGGSQGGYSPQSGFTLSSYGQRRSPLSTGSGYRSLPAPSKTPSYPPYRPQPISYPATTVRKEEETYAVSSGYKKPTQPNPYPQPAPSYPQPQTPRSYPQPPPSNPYPRPGPSNSYGQPQTTPYKSGGAVENVENVPEYTAAESGFSDPSLVGLPPLEKIRRKVFDLAAPAFKAARMGKEEQEKWLARELQKTILRIRQASGGTNTNAAPLDIVLRLGGESGTLTGHEAKLRAPPARPTTTPKPTTTSTAHGKVRFASFGRSSDTGPRDVFAFPGSSGDLAASMGFLEEPSEWGPVPPVAGMFIADGHPNAKMLDVNRVVE